MMATISVLAALPSPTYTAPSICTNPIQPGTPYTEEPSYYSVNGVLNVTLTLYTWIDAGGNECFCHVSSRGDRNPTFHLYPGDNFIVTVVNHVMATKTNITSTNVHFHGK